MDIDFEQRRINYLAQKDEEMAMSSNSGSGSDEDDRRGRRGRTFGVVLGDEFMKFR